jgi:hypothetical protein
MSDIYHHTISDAQPSGRAAGSDASRQLFEHAYAGGPAHERKDDGLKIESKSQGNPHLPGVELFDSTAPSKSKDAATHDKPAAPAKKPVDIPETKLPGFAAPDVPAKNVERNYNGKDYTEISRDDKDGSKKYTHYDDATKTTDSVTRDKVGNPLVRTHDDPNTASTRIYNGRDYTDISIDKKTGNSTTVRHNDKFQSNDTVYGDKNGKVIKRTHDTEV